MGTTTVVINVVEADETEFDTVNQMLEKSANNSCSSSDWELCLFAREFYLQLAANGSSIEDAYLRTEYFREKLEDMWESFKNTFRRGTSSTNNISYERFGKLIEKYNMDNAGEYFLPLTAIPIIWKAYTIARVVMVDEDAFDEAINFYEDCKSAFDADVQFTDEEEGRIDDDDDSDF